ncbi:MAG: YgiT-type zinc finger protein [Anaerolineae bacterium]|jgi:YgiT-type zinc finger domain-containing protein|nr:YgiT-type zinc finger protein [Anaerolineae bacterium]
MRLQYTTYFTWLMDELITVPDFPSWVCDVCGRREYDQVAVNQLHLMLNPTSGRPTPRRYPKQPQDHQVQLPSSNLE